MPLAGQIIRAADFDGMTPLAYTQGTDQNVASSTTLVNSSIVVPITGPVKVELHARFMTGGGGIRWAWSETGTITTALRLIHSAGGATSGSNSDIASMRLRAVATTTEEQLQTQFQNSTTHYLTETLFLDGAGSVTFRFAQQASNAANTTLWGTSRAVVEPCEVAA